MKNILRLRTARRVLAELVSAHPQRRRIPARLLGRLQTIAPRSYLQALHQLGECELAGDFKFLGPAALRLENLHREQPQLRLGELWWIFATSGTGDAWLIRRAGRSSEVAFLDHDRESSAATQPLLLTFAQWLSLGDLMGQLESSIEPNQLHAKPEIARRARALMNRLSPGLARRYPYAILCSSTHHR